MSVNIRPLLYDPGLGAKSQLDAARPKSLKLLFHVNQQLK